MDKVQIYYTVLLSLGLFLSGFMNGKPKNDPYHRWYDWFIGVAFGLPMIGRVFNWW